VFGRAFIGSLFVVMLGQHEFLRAARPWLGRVGGRTARCGWCSGVWFLHAPSV
jgi:hypothetical protein